MKGARNKVIYLAGPYTADTPEKVSKNILYARDYAMKLWDDGWTVICPHLNTAFFEAGCKKAGYEDFMTGDFEIISRCDKLFVLPGWRNSSGTKREIAYAKANGVPIKYLR